MNNVSLSYTNGKTRKDTMQKLIYRGYEILDDVKSYNLYGDNDELIRIFNKKDDVKLEDVYKHVDKMRKDQNAGS